MSYGRVLVLNRDYSPLTMVAWDRAVCLLWQGRAQTIEEDETIIISSPNWETYRPLVVIIDDYVKIKKMPNNRVVRRVMFARDNWECQYCSKPITPRTGTIDHVKPRSAFLKEGRSARDAHTWDNVVSACSKCNLKKADRLPHEVRMYPKKTPKIPNFVQTYWAGKKYHPIQREYIAQFYKINPETLESFEIDMPDNDWIDSAVDKWIGESY